MTKVLADLGVQLEGFAQEIRELRAVVRQLGGTPPRTSLPGDTTLDVDVEGFRRMRRRRLLALAAIGVAPLLVLGLWAAWPKAVPEPVQAVHPLPAAPREAAPAPRNEVAEAEVAPARPAEVSPVPAPPPASSPQEAADPRPAIRPKARAPALRPAPAEVEPALPGRIERAPWEPARAAPVVVHETSGGAPILD